MEDRLAIIVESISSINSINIKQELVEHEGVIDGIISVTEYNKTLDFYLKIFDQYPSQFHEMETIKFLNKEIIEYGHVNRDGSICIHTPHNADLKSKIYYDLLSLKQWMITYYINKDIDSHYSHIIVPESSGLSKRHCYLFTDVIHNFKQGEFGLFKYSLLSEGVHNEKNVLTHLVQNFNRDSKTQIECSWSTPYKKLRYKQGLYVFVETPPVHYRRFIIDNWNEMEPYVSQEFLKFLDWAKKNNNLFQNNETELPLLIGYRIPNDQMHWQCAVITQNEFPTYAEKIEGKFIGRLNTQCIKWVQTKNCSYQYFFGRGALCEELTEKRILIIGLGAIGSIVATTLTRGGCKNLRLADYDIKEPENICRSEYHFNTGLNDKMEELQTVLSKISPFVEVTQMPGFMDLAKAYIRTNSKEIKLILDQYDYIFDCSTDNDLAYMLDILHLRTEVVNLSITNHAKELVCAVKPNLYKWLMEIYRKFKVEENELYNPTGCWNPTFKASYNDINAMVQHAVKHINFSLETGKVLRSFYLSSDTSNGYNIKLNQF